MSKKMFGWWVASVLAALSLSELALAQAPSEFNVIANGLNGPRGLKFGPDGELYVALAGTGGTISTGTQCTQVPGPVGPYKGGNTGAIVKINRAGKVSVVASGLPSTAANTGDLSGVSDVAFLNGTLYALIAGGGCSHGNAKAPNGIARVDQGKGSWSLISDLSEFAMTHPGKYDDLGDFEPDGVWFSMISYKGKLLAVEPNRGIIVAVQPNGRAQELIDVSASQGHIVPTGIAEHEGDLYLGNLLYFPILPQWSRVLRLSPLNSGHDEALPGFASRGEYAVTDSKAGFTTVVAVTIGPDGLLYVLELSDPEDFEHPGTHFPAPGTGKVIRVQHSGQLQEVITGLTVPGGMTWGPDGRLYISDLSAVPAPGGVGRILQFDVAFGY
jgi:hypothetical protein